MAAATASNILSHPSLVKETMILNGHVSSAPRPQHAALEASRVEGPSCSSATETSQPQASGLPSHRHAPQAGQHPAKSGPDLLPAIPAPNMRLVRAASLPVHTSHGSNEALFTTAAYPGAGVAAPATATATAASLRRAPSEISFSHIDGSPSASTAVANSGTRGPVMAVTCGDESSPMSSSSESSLEASAAAAPGALASASAQVQVPLPAPHPTQASGDATGAESDLAGAEAPTMLTGAATGVDGTGNQVVQRKGRFTLLKPAAQAAPAAGSCSAAPELSQASTGDSAPAAVLQATTAQMPPLEDDNGQAAMQPPPSTTEPANITKRKGRFTLTQETSAPLTIVVDRAPAPPPPAVNHPHQPPSHPDRERGSSVASAAMSSISASITAAAEQGSIGPPPVAPEPPPAEAPAATTAVATATSPSLASNSSVRTVKKMGRFVVSSVSGFDPQSTASVAAATAAPPAAPQPDDVAPGPPPSAPQEPGHYPPSVISDSGGPAHAGSSAVPQPQSGGRGIPREVLTIVDPGLAGPSEAPVAPPAAQAVPQPLHPPSLPPPSQPVLYALVPANVHLPSQPVIGGGSAHSAGPTHSQDRTAFAPPGQADHVGSASIRPVLSSGNLAAADGAAVRQDAYVQANPAISARLPAHESEAVPVPPAVNDAPRPKEMLPATASQPPPPSSGATARNGGYTGRQGVGKMFHYLDQLRLEATDAERTIKNLQTDVRLLVRPAFMRAISCGVY